MGKMKDIATDLELHWDEFFSGYQRTMPDGRIATLRPIGDDWTLRVGAERTVHASLPEAVLAAGQIARQQLAGMAETWVAA